MSNLPPSRRLREFNKQWRSLIRNLDPLLDSYSESYQSGAQVLDAVHPAGAGDNSSCGQSWQFTTGDPKYKLDYAKFYLGKYGDPTGNLVAVLYASTGTHGTDAKPTGSALATSNPIDIADLPSEPGVYTLFNFVFPTPKYLVVKNTVYIIQCQVQSGVLDGSNYAMVGFDYITVGHAGNFSRYSNGWLVSALYDTCFYVYGETILAPTVTTQDATDIGLD